MAFLGHWWSQVYMGYPQLVIVKLHNDQLGHRVGCLSRINPTSVPARDMRLLTAHTPGPHCCSKRKKSNVASTAATEAASASATANSRRQSMLRGTDQIWSEENRTKIIKPYKKIGLFPVSQPALLGIIAKVRRSPRNEQN